MMMHARQRSSPFTASQWLELERQALVFKYMISGMPIPSDLLYSVRRSRVLQDLTIPPLSPATPRLFPTPHLVGWGCFQVGCGTKADPEPGRCRRTDGKKWRCSREAFRDSKYCEKHMNRGRNRSRKHVEAAATAAKASSPDPSPNSPQPLHPYFPFPFRPPQIRPPHFILGNGPIASADQRDYRYLQGLKEEVDEHPFFSEPSGSLRSISVSPFDASWRSNSGSLRPCGFSLGADVKLDSPGKTTESRPLRQFFNEWPLKSRSDSWLDLEENPSNQSSSFSATQLSISIPISASDVPAVNPVPHRGE